jgi:hypothetical protein
MIGLLVRGKKKPGWSSQHVPLPEGNDDTKKEKTLGNEVLPGAVIRQKAPAFKGEPCP